MAIFSDSPTIKNPKIGGSAPQNTSVGSGSRPTKSKIMIETSAPKNPHTLGRGVPGALGMGNSGKMD
jgi:hypothetical protein